MVKEYNNGIETQENLERFKKFCKAQSKVRGKEVKPNLANWIVWKDKYRDREIL